jgi:hypothetical protein
VADAVTLKPLPPREAVEFFKAKGLTTSFAWQDVWQEEHARAFTVAKAMSRDILVDIREGLERALEEGKTFEDFRSSVRPLLEAKGWWGRKPMTDPMTGETRPVQLGSNRRLRTIFDTNLRSAYQAGRWERVQASKAALPYLMYHHTPQAHPRLEHRAWDRTILPVDHPWWRTHYTPNGWRCKCWTSQLSKAAMERRGLKVTDKPIRFPPKVYTNPRTGEVTVVEGGIDPGFNFNIGQAYLDPVTARPTNILPAPAGPPAAPPIDPRNGPPLLRPGVDADDARDAFLRAFGATRATPVTFTDVGGEPFVAGPALFETTGGKPFKLSAAAMRTLPLVARTIRYPEEIRWAWREGKGGARQLQRRYVAQLAVEGEAIGVVVDVGLAGGWSFTTSLDKGFDLAALRTGALAWRRQTAAELKISAKERRALTLYTGPYHKEFNGHLRQGDLVDDDTAEHIAQLDALLSRSRLGAPMVLYRTIAGDAAEELIQDATEPGTIFFDDGFMSTSRDPVSAARFDSDYGEALFMVIRARAGDAALDVSAWSATGSEHEVLFSRGTRLKVIGWDDDTRTLTVETLDPE